MLDMPIDSNRCFSSLQCSMKYIHECHQYHTNAPGLNTHVSIAHEYDLLVFEKWVIEPRLMPGARFRTIHIRWSVSPCIDNWQYTDAIANQCPILSYLPLILKSGGRYWTSGNLENAQHLSISRQSLSTCVFTFEVSYLFDIHPMNQQTDCLCCKP